MDEGAVACPSCGRQYQTYTTPRRTDGQAIAALVLGIAGLLMCPVIPSIIAIVIGNQAKQRLRYDPTLQGEELANVGVILGWIGFGLGIVGITVVVIFFVVSFGSIQFN
jgi:hypothetical protein